MTYITIKFTPLFSARGRAESGEDGLVKDIPILLVSDVGLVASEVDGPASRLGFGIRNENRKINMFPGPL